VSAANTARSAFSPHVTCNPALIFQFLSFQSILKVHRDEIKQGNATKTMGEVTYNTGAPCVLQFFQSNLLIFAQFTPWLRQVMITSKQQHMPSWFTIADQDCYQDA